MQALLCAGYRDVEQVGPGSGPLPGAGLRRVAARDKQDDLGFLALHVWAVPWTSCRFRQRLTSGCREVPPSRCLIGHKAKRRGIGPVPVPGTAALPAGGGRRELEDACRRMEFDALQLELSGWEGTATCWSEWEGNSTRLVGDIG